MIVKIAVMMTASKPDALMSSHFGKAPWLMVADQKSEAFEFVQNEAKRGCGAASTIVQHGCTDVIVVDIGDGALNHLHAAHIRAWATPAAVSGRQALLMFADGQLAQLSVARSDPRPPSHTQASCSHGAGSSSGCCHGQSQS